ncbi:YtxH domain-containing protein [Agriterribacter sp.]|uniref:YtxH domain-containing protein n=1 Tax=Agriterribacter sp. TaxID=2821509 RepID=UPI002CC2DCF4|nr:YtxH domain-containing protein [Agriterribacter sp.]HRO45152.1 YtxH domain-containing protein [Agriterribacter sp.]HRQ17757.1 YtxH domain-containing protein [Agriterribacter sp.]
MKADSKVLLGLLAGAAIGAIAGILFAPDKGSETRKKITKNTSDMGDQLKHTFNDFIDTVKDKYRSAKNEVEDVAEKGKVSTFSNQAKNSVV